MVASRRKPHEYLSMVIAFSHLCFCRVSGNGRQLLALTIIYIYTHQYSLHIAPGYNYIETYQYSASSTQGQYTMQELAVNAQICS